MNKIYINARFLGQNITGVQRFAIELTKILSELRNDIVFLVPHSIDEKLIPSNFKFIQIGKRSGLYWEQIELPSFLKKKGNPLLISLCNRAPIFYKNNVVAIHDVTFRRYPKSVSFIFGLFYRLMMPYLISHAKQVITVSEFSKKEILSFYPKSHSKTVVIYNAVDEKFKAQYQCIDKSNYLLAVSSDYLHKNFERLIEAFILLKDPLITLKIIGNKGEIAEKYKCLNNIEFVGRVSDDELIVYYQNALAFIFPSLYEGFGIPPLEAQACGCPVVSSNLSAMPEILGQSVLYFNPLDINCLAKAMNKIIIDKKLCNDLIEKGHKNITRFSWIESAKKINNMIIDMEIKQEK